LFLYIQVATQSNSIYHGIMSDGESYRETIMWSIHEGIRFLDTNRRNCYCNSGEERITGHASNEPLGRSHADEIPVQMSVTPAMGASHSSFYDFMDAMMNPADSKLLCGKNSGKNCIVSD